MSLRAQTSSAPTSTRSHRPFPRRSSSLVSHPSSSSRSPSSTSFSAGRPSSPLARSSSLPPSRVASQASTARSKATSSRRQTGASRSYRSSSTPSGRSRCSGGRSPASIASQTCARSSWEGSSGAPRSMRECSRTSRWSAHGLIYSILRRGMMFLSTGIPAVVTLSTFGSFVFIQKQTLTASTAFTAMSLFGLLREAVGAFSRPSRPSSSACPADPQEPARSVGHLAPLGIHARKRVSRTHPRLPRQHRRARPTSAQARHRRGQERLKRPGHLDRARLALPLLALHAPERIHAASYRSQEQGQGAVIPARADDARGGRCRLGQVGAAARAPRRAPPRARERRDLCCRQGAARAKSQDELRRAEPLAAGYVHQPSCLLRAAC